MQLLFLGFVLLHPVFIKCYATVEVVYIQNHSLQLLESCPCRVGAQRLFMQLGGGSLEKR